MGLVKLEAQRRTPDEWCLGVVGLGQVLQLPRDRRGKRLEMIEDRALPSNGSVRWDFEASGVIVHLTSWINETCDAILAHEHLDGLLDALSSDRQALREHVQIHAGVAVDLPKSHVARPNPVRLPS